MKHDLLVSVITPVYNHGSFVGRSIESLISQSYSNWELVVVDDGSTDNSAEVVQSYKDPRIKYIHQENQGVKKLAHTINRGMSFTSGELVTMLPSDDTWPSYRLEKQVPVFEDPSVVLCYGYQNIINEHDEQTGKYRLVLEDNVMRNSPLGTIYRQMLVKNFIFQPTVLIRRSALDKIGGYLQPEGLFAEDFPTQLALAQVGEFRYLDIPLANYRMHSNQMTRTHYGDMIETDARFILEYFMSLDPLFKNRSGWTDASLKKALQKNLHNNYFSVGRRLLVNQDWSAARRYFAQAIFGGSLKTKIRATVGLGCSLLRRDMEKLSRWGGASAPLKGK